MNQKGLNNNADSRRIFITVMKTLTGKSEQECRDLMNSGKPILLKKKVQLFWNDGLYLKY